jgi:hypothetical protein
MIIEPGFPSISKDLNGFGGRQFLSSVLDVDTKSPRSLDADGFKNGNSGALHPFTAVLPSPTIFLDVSGRNKIITNKQQGDIVARNQKIDRHPQRSINNPLTIGPILGGVLSTNETMPEYPPLSAGVNKSPITP